MHSRANGPMSKREDGIALTGIDWIWPRPA
jgi:hypothetical protein